MATNPGTGRTPRSHSGAPTASAKGKDAQRPVRDTTGQPGKGRGRKDYGMTGNTAHRPEEFNPDDFE